MAGVEALERDDAQQVAKAWNHVRGNLRRSAGQRLFEQWLKPVVLMADSDVEFVRLGLPSPFMTQWVRNHYADRLLIEFRAVLPSVKSVAIETLAEERRVITPEAPSVPAAPAGERPALDPRFTFERFVVDASNRVAFNAARALAQPGAPRFSPLFVHSGTGQGKTHLMHAIGHAFMAANPGASVIYMPAERFMFEFVQALRNKETLAFKTRMRSVDLLLIDDLQFIGGGNKDSTQEEFLHTVNELMNGGKRIVIAADRAPQGLEGFEPRLVSRLGAGLVADIKPPELDLRRAILGRKLGDMDGAEVPGEVLDLLAGRITGNIRELEGALNRLVAYAQLNGEAVTMDFAMATLSEVLRGTQKRITIDEIQRAVCAQFDVKQLDLISERRAVAIARPRQIAMYLAKRLTTRSLPEIGRKFGNRDHSTVIHAVRRIEELRGLDREIDGAVRALMQQLGGTA
jgi:chromosomal replication initiator protein